jgi:hypothetical protein
MILRNLQVTFETPTSLVFLPLRALQISEKDCPILAKKSLKNLATKQFPILLVFHKKPFFLLLN